MYPEAQLVYGPPVEDGFYYDMAMPDGTTLSSDDFERLEKAMAEIIKSDRTFTRKDMPLEDALSSFVKTRVSPYK